MGAVRAGRGGPAESQLQGVCFFSLPAAAAQDEEESGAWAELSDPSGLSAHPPPPPPGLPGLSSGSAMCAR